MAVLNRDTCLLPFVGTLLIAPIGFLIVGPLLWETIRGWPAWLAALTFGLATVVTSGALCVAAIRIKAWWRRRRSRGQ